MSVAHWCSRWTFVVETFKTCARFAIHESVSLLSLSSVHSPELLTIGNTWHFLVLPLQPFSVAEPHVLIFLYHAKGDHTASWVHQSPVCAMVNAGLFSLHCGDKIRFTIYFSNHRSSKKNSQNSVQLTFLLVIWLHNTHNPDLYVTRDEAIVPASSGREWYYTNTLGLKLHTGFVCVCVGVCRCG